MTIPLARILDHMQREAAGDDDAVLEVRGVTKAYGDRQVLRGIDLQRAASTTRSR